MRKCLLDNGDILCYDYCYDRLMSEHNSDKFLGQGVIYSINGELVEISKKYYFYVKEN